MKQLLNFFSPAGLLFLFTILILTSCEKQDALTPQPEPAVTDFYISFQQDTIPVKLSITSGRRETINQLLTTAIDGKLPDSISNKTSLVIRVTGDSARTYTGAQILASYTDSSGNTYSNTATDTINVVKLTKLEKKRDGNIEGSFTIRVSNFTKTKTLILANGKIYSVFDE